MTDKLSDKVRTFW